MAYGLHRTSTTELLTCWGGLFVVFFYHLHAQKIQPVFKLLIAAAVVFRLLFLFSVPSLSDDYFRFIWDGELLANGINPFLFTPTEVLNNNELDLPRLDAEMYAGLNSPDYYSVYPPVMQLVFWLSAKLSTSTLGAIIIMRSTIILCEVGTIYILTLLLDRIKLPKANVFLYALNPLVIIELTGNLHFEAVMIFFLVLSLFLLTSRKFLFSALSFSLSVCSKLVPLVLLPIMLRYLGLKKFTVYASVVLLAIVLFFMPFVNNELINNISESIGLYFQTFEFNASIYYLIREIGYWIKGYNIISIAGKLLPITFLLFYGIYLLRTKLNDIHTTVRSSVWILTAYYLTALIVHPWYISLLVVLSVSSNLRFALVWSAMIGITYITYSTTPYKENLYAVTIEYIVVLSAIVYDVRQRSQSSIVQ